mmetsp:Transcript_7233/g.24954  ORF Transcript_7233/g.24954 Transcript_7233/m.24954 type:complete len:253 (-) Transcript_7233:1511-2269(-)
MTHCNDVSLNQRLLHRAPHLFLSPPPPLVQDPKPLAHRVSQQPHPPCPMEPGNDSSTSLGPPHKVAPVDDGDVQAAPEEARDCRRALGEAELMRVVGRHGDVLPLVVAEHEGLGPCSRKHGSYLPAVIREAHERHDQPVLEEEAVPLLDLPCHELVELGPLMIREELANRLEQRQVGPTGHHVPDDRSIYTKVLHVLRVMQESSAQLPGVHSMANARKHLCLPLPIEERGDPRAQVEPQARVLEPHRCSLVL